MVNRASYRLSLKTGTEREGFIFTGIVEEIGSVLETTVDGLTISATVVVDGLESGCSINVNGTCLTITTLDGAAFCVDVVPETLRCSNLGQLNVGDLVNLERPLLVGGRLDGHIVQGHLDGTGKIETVTSDGDSLMMSVQAPASIMRYVVAKGFVAVDGASLTVVNCDDNVFTFTVIPYTQTNTVLGMRKPGDVVNIEVDVVGKYVRSLLR